MNKYSLENLLTNIRNGQQARLLKIKQPKSKYSLRVLDILYKEGYISGYTFDSKIIFILLKYYNNFPVIQKIKQISKPSRRVYISNKGLSKISSEEFIYLINSNKGIVSNKQALLNNVGGEIICKIF